MKTPSGTQKGNTCKFAVMLVIEGKNGIKMSVIWEMLICIKKSFISVKSYEKNIYMDTLLCNNLSV